MAVQGVKSYALQIVCEDDGSAIVTKSIIKSKAVYNAIQRRHDFGVGFAPNVDAEV